MPNNKWVKRVGVLPGSTLYVWVEPGQNAHGNYVAIADLYCDHGYIWERLDITAADSEANAAVTVLADNHHPQGDHNHVLTVEGFFSDGGASNAIIKHKIVKPDGTVHAPSMGLYPHTVPDGGGVYGEQIVFIYI